LPLYVNDTFLGGGYHRPCATSLLPSSALQQWHPDKSLPVTRTSHPLDTSCTIDTLQAVKACCNQQEDDRVADHPSHPLIFVQTKHLRALLSHSSMVSDVVITFYLEILTNQYDITYLSTSFTTSLQQQGWPRLQSHFALYRDRPRTNSRPRLSRESAIILPCFVNGCHWVTVVRREVAGQVIFLYADDLNQSSTERFLKNLLFSDAPEDFYPASAIWVNCINFTYAPHSNECGPRSLLAATILALHPQPSNTILLAAMHPNLAQTLCTWLGCQIITQSIDDNAIQALLNISLDATNRRIAPSSPYLFSWEDSICHSGTTFGTSGHTKLRATAPIFYPRTAPSLSCHNTSSSSLSLSHLPVTVNSKEPDRAPTRPVDKKSCNCPAKRVNLVLPGQKLLTSFLCKRITTTPLPEAASLHVPSLSIPPVSSSQSSHNSSPSIQQTHQADPPEPVPPAQPMVPNQRTLFDFAFFKPQLSITEADPDVWGHVPEQIDTSATFRVILQNPNGIRPSVTEHEFLFSLHISHEIGVGALCLAETNLNWHHSQHKFALKRCLHRNWQSSKFQTSVPDETFLGNYQPGGTATIVVDRWTFRVIASGMDPFGLGRWSYITLRGKSDINICIITAYRVCNDRYTGPKTAYQQQKRQLSSLFHSQSKVVPLDPYRQFILDLHSWITSLQALGTQIILCLDNNEELLPNKGQLITLPPSDHPIIHPTHDGTLETLVCSTGLTDILRHHHPSSTYPPTYNRGKKHIDLILASASLLSSITRSGILPYNSIFQGDHRPCYIDLDASLAFGGHTAPVCPPCQRGLQLHDPRRIDEYLSTLHAQLHLHKVLTKVNNLHAKASSGWSDSDLEEYKRLDTLITEAMLYSERATSRRFTKTYEWSPILMKAVYAERYWRQAYKRSIGKFVSDEQFIRTRQLAGIPFQSHPLHLPYILQCLSAAREIRKILQKDHHTLCKNYLEKLAESIVVKRSPSMLDPKNDNRREKRTAKEVRRLIRLEHKRYLYRLIGNTLADKHANVNGLSRVDVPAPFLQTPKQLVDPKTWRGPWVSITDPSEIARQICTINTMQYNQAQNTPFGSGYLANQVGMTLEGPATEQILQGTFTPDPAIRLLPETERIIKYLGVPPTGTKHTFPISITPEEFKSTYTLVKERTSSSVSGRHVGHYKAATTDDVLSLMHSRMMSLPYIVGFSPIRWRKVVDVMLEKEPGNPKIHRLRIIALIESDYNQSQRILLARQLSHKMEDINLVPEMQYGSRPGHLCISPVLNKQLTHDIIGQTKQTAAFIENDAVGCYDRLMNPLVLLAMRWLGVPEPLTKAIAFTWSNTTNSIKTQYGISSVCYTNTPETPLFGPGQGSTTGPTLWQVSFVILEDSALAAGIDILELEEPIHPLALTSVDGEVDIDNPGEAFVDNSNLASCSTEPSHPHEVSITDQNVHCSSAVSNLQSIAQRWERALFSTGGAINFSKSFWFDFHWTWKGGIARLTAPPSSVQLTLTEGDHLTHPVQVPHKSVHDTYRTLGVHISPSGDTAASFQVLLGSIAVL